MHIRTPRSLPAGTSSLAEIRIEARGARRVQNGRCCDLRQPAADADAARATTARETEHIEEPATQDFDINPDKVVLPKKAEDEPLTPEELDRAVESFISALPQR